LPLPFVFHAALMLVEAFGAAFVLAGTLLACIMAVILVPVWVFEGFP
jgi:hypothetical protein